MKYYRNVSKRGMTRYIVLALMSSCVMTVGMAQGVNASATPSGSIENAVEDTYTLTPYVVTATRAKTELSKTPANVTVVQGEEIRAKNLTNMSDVLRNVPGVTIGNYGTGIGYENANSTYINGSNNVVWMIDGIVMNSAGQNAPLVALKNMNNIERVEVVKGAASALYGSSAVGGVINIITKKPTEGMTTKLRALRGSYDQEQYVISNEGREKGWFWSASYQKDIMANYRDAHGLTIPQHLNARTGSFMLGKEIDSNNTLTVYHNTYRANEKYSDSNKNLGIINYGNAAYDSSRAVLQSKIGAHVQNTLSVLNQRYDTTYAGYTTYIQTRSIADQITYATPNNTLLGGFEWRQDRINTMNGIKLTNMSYYVQDAWQFAPKWMVTPGVRLDHHSAFGNRVSPHIALAYNPNEKTNMYISFNSYFIAPTPYSLYDATYGNPNLKPETGNAWELGVTHQFNETTTGGVHFFTRSSKDKIGYDYITSKYANFDEEKAHGFSLDVAKQFTKELSARMGYTYTHVNATPQRQTNADGYIPKHSVIVGVDYVKTRWDAHLDVRGVIDRPGVQGYSDFFPKKTYWITDISANYHINDTLTVFGRVGNLFNVFYAESSNVRWGLPNEWWTAPGRNFQLGMELKF